MKKNASAECDVSHGAGWILRAWLMLAVGALALAGLLAVVLVVSRAPFARGWLPQENFFQVALIVHVNLSVLVWLLSFLCALFVSQRPCRFGSDRLPFAMAAGGTLAMAVSPFVAASEPFLNNYVPILKNTVFLYGLSFFLFGVLTQTLFFLKRAFPQVVMQRKAAREGVNSVALLAIAVILLCAFAAFGWSMQQVVEAKRTATIGLRETFELIFWGGGHLLQYAYTLAMLLCWLWLSGHRAARGAVPACAFLLSLAVVLAFPYPYLSYRITAFEHTEWFTHHMRWGGGISAIIIGLFVVHRLRKAFFARTVEQYALLSSVILFAGGGAIGWMITESNTRIPAHYHGSIVGVTLAFMGVFYMLLRQQGYPLIWPKLTRWQPVCYGFGQLLHVIGLLQLGGYGAMRKTPGITPEFADTLAVHAVRWGGLFAVIGGLLFILCAGLPLLRGRTNEAVARD